MVKGDDILSRLLGEEKVAGLRYSVAVSVLRSCRYDEVGNEGPYCTWKHHVYPKLLTLRDEGTRPMHSGYVKQLSKHLRVVQDLGGF